MILKFAWKHISSRPISGILTVIGATLVLTLLGSFWALKDNLSQAQSTSPNQSSTINVFVKQGTLNTEVKRVLGLLNSSKFIQQSRVVSTQEAFKELESEFGETLTKAVSEEALPTMITASLINSPIDRTAFISMLETLRKQESILEVDAGEAFSPRTLETNTESRLINWAFVLFAMVFVIVALLISHIIRLAFEGNKDDIETLKVLGASKTWIFAPILIEALFYGLVSVFLTVITLNLSIQILLPAFASHLLPKNFEFFTLSLQSWVGVISVAIGASIIGALMTYPLIKKPAGRA